MSGSGTNTGGTSGGGALTLSKTTLRLLGIAVVLFAATETHPIVSTVCLAVGIVLVVWSIRANLPTTSGSEHRWAAIASATLMTGLLGRPIATIPSSITPARAVVVIVGLVACVIAFVVGHRPLGRRISTLLSLTVAIVILIASIGGEWSSTWGSDVYHAHRLAGAALTAGENPYTDAVTFADGNPFAPDDRVFEGYPYPPVTLFAYGLAGAFTDPRLISALCWLIFLGWLGLRAWTLRASDSPMVGLSVLLLMSMAPLGSEIWYMAWTEPLTLALFLLAALAWTRSPIGSGVLLGVGLASKQYLIFLLPLVLLHRDEGWRRRSMAAIGTAVATLLVGLIPDSSAFLQATIGNLTSIGFRPDTQSLPGLIHELGSTFMLPNWLWIGMTLLVVGVLAKSSRTRSGFLIRSALGLAFAFLAGLGFPNYWFLVAGLIAIGTVFDPIDSAEDSSVASGLGSQRAWQETRIAGV
jgi:hypothetical protein